MRLAFPLLLSLAMIKAASGYGSSFENDRNSLVVASTGAPVTAAALPFTTPASAGSLTKGPTESNPNPNIWTKGILERARSLVTLTWKNAAAPALLILSLCIIVAGRSVIASAGKMESQTEDDVSSTSACPKHEPSGKASRQHQVLCNQGCVPRAWRSVREAKKENSIRELSGKYVHLGLFSVIVLYFACTHCAHDKRFARGISATVELSNVARALQQRSLWQTHKCRTLCVDLVARGPPLVRCQQQEQKQQRWLSASPED
ncbi:hypothetical protein, conserved [Eimeria necatrix]|uniref:Transmembrane protein n=1 Tax=Eimeria necatrix TaxID=51315 RepID=U6N5S9_9EIME|nr:hypothetical protein, conserved [Eimeria necatrix]CDJ69275.1 hypothetical protein, conserved [Eimeria necatrix]